MRPLKFNKSDYQPPTINPYQKPRASSPPKRYQDDTDARDFGNASTPLTKRICHIPLDSADSSPTSREQLGGKGMFLQRMVEAGLPVPPFKCATTKVVNALEQHPLDTVRLARYLPEIDPKLKAETSLASIRQYLQTLPPSEQAKRDNWLAGLTQFVASDDFYEQVKDSQAARDIRALRAQLGEPSTPVIVRSSGINEDNYGDAQAGKYLSEVQGVDDVLRTCLKVMASSYRPEVCAGGAPQPMALILQQCIDCQYGGVAMSYQSLQDDTVRVEYTSGQPKGAVAGQYGITPHRIEIARKEGADDRQYFPGTATSHFILRKNSTNNGYTETEIGNVGVRPDGDGQRLTDDQIASLMQMVRMLEDLLHCPIEIEFAIDHLGQVFVLQVRPITRLSGGMDFAMPPPAPKETLVSGIGVSEGYCTGSLWRANSQAVDTMPEGAIVVAKHGEEWMLEPQCLKRAAGFVFATGGTNDHVAITLRQAERPCLLAGDQYPAVADYDSKQATLACARFNGTPSAFVVTGDLTERLASHRCLSSAFSDVPSAQAVASRDDLSPPEDTFSQVATAFRWLTDQNARLLAFFAPGGGLDCLANPIKLSMSAQRSEILAVTQDNINLLTLGAQAMLDGYQAFLQLAGDSRSDELKPLRDELAVLIPRFETLKQSIKSGLEHVALPMKAGEKVQVSPGMFRQWIEDCHQLHGRLQAFCPCMANYVQSVHDLIYLLHRGFVRALAPVTFGSRQGKISRSIKENITYFDYTSPEQEAGLLSPSCKTAIEKLNCKVAVASMDDALIVNLNLGNHMSLVELLECAEGGKGRTLRLTFSDEFDRPDGSDNPGALKRMWFLVQLLKAIKLGENGGGIKLSCNAEAGKITVECPQMTSRQAMQEAFEKLIPVLNDTRNLDLRLAETALFEDEQWSFYWLAQHLDSDFSEADRFALKQCIFSMVYRYGSIFNYVKLLDKQYRQFIEYADKIRKSQDANWEVLWEMLGSDKIGDQTRRELLHHLLFINLGVATPMIEHEYGQLQNKYFVLKPFCGYRPEFSIEPSQSLEQNREKVKSVLLEHGLEYASQSVRNDKGVVLPAIEAHPDDLRYVSDKLKSDKDVVLTAVTQKGDRLSYAGPELQDNEQIVRAAVKANPMSLKHASERIRGDKDIIQIAIDNHIDYLSLASKEVLKDRKYILGLITNHPRAYRYAAHDLKIDKTFVSSAIERNPEVLEYM